VCECVCVPQYAARILNPTEPYSLSRPSFRGCIAILVLGQWYAISRRRIGVTLHEYRSPNGVTWGWLLSEIVQVKQGYMSQVCVSRIYISRMLS
jgi:hypothetical protein